MKVIVKIYDEMKYSTESKKVGEIEYDIEGFKVIGGGAEAQDIEEDLNDDSTDEFHEYLVLDLGNGKTTTFRNSHVDMFKKF